VTDQPSRRADSSGKQSFSDAWASLDSASRFRNVTLGIQLLSLVIVVVGYIIASNGGSPVLAYVGVVGVIGMVALRLIAAVVGMLRRRQQG